MVSNLSKHPYRDKRGSSARERLSMNALELQEDATAAPQTDVLVRLNLRGTVFHVPRSAADAQPTSTLSKALRGVLRPEPLRDDDGVCYFNRNPLLFHLVLDTLVVGEVPETDGTGERKRLEKELQFWGVRPKRGREQTDAVQGSSREGALRRFYGDLEVIPPAGKSSPFGT